MPLLRTTDSTVSKLAGMARVMAQTDPPLHPVDKLAAAQLYGRIFYQTGGAGDPESYRDPPQTQKLLIGSKAGYPRCPASTILAGLPWNGTGRQWIPRRDFFGRISRYFCYSLMQWTSLDVLERYWMLGRGRFRQFLLSQYALSCVDHEPESRSFYNDSSSRKSSRVTPRTMLPSNRSELMTSSFSREKVLVNQSNSNGEA